MNNPEPSWDLYRTFLAVLDEGSLSGAARALNLTQPTVGRHIEALETSVGFDLFIRSQRGLAPTDAALELRPLAQTLASTAAALRRVASGQGSQIKGTVRISASEMMGAEVLPAILASIRELHPALEFELVLSNEVDNLLRRDADIAIRMTEPTQEALTVQRIGEITIGAHAHRRYLERRGTPRRLADLEGHSLIGFDRETPALRALRQRAPGLDAAHFAFRSDSDIAQFAAIKAGFGIGFCQAVLARRDPELVRLLPGDLALSLGVSAAMHEDLRSTPRCRATFDALVAGLRHHVDP